MGMDSDLPAPLTMMRMVEGGDWVPVTHRFFVSRSTSRIQSPDHVASYQLCIHAG